MRNYEIASRKVPITWVVVADGARAHIAAMSGTAELRPALDYDFAGPGRVHTNAAVSDRPGRSFDSARIGRHAMEPRSDWHDNAKRVFVRDVTDTINRAGEEGRFDRLVLVAPPKALGDIRDRIETRVRAKVVAEIGKDLTHLPLDRLAAYLDESGIRTGTAPRASHP